MAIKSKAELKAYFQTGGTPTEAQFVDLIDSTISKVQNLNFTGRFYFYGDKRWVGTSPNYGIATENFRQTHGVGSTPKVIWNSLGIGFLPKKTILHRLEFVGRVNSTDISDIEVQLSIQGNNFDETGYNTIAQAVNQVILAPTALGTSATNLTKMQRHTVDLGDYVLNEDKIIEFCCRPVRTNTATRYWTAHRRLYFTLP